MRPSFFYYITAFAAGMAVMVAELTLSRLLAPYFGTSLFVWTNVIALVMLALSAGYYFGGRLADKNPKPSLYFLLLGGAGLWLVVLPFFAPLLFQANLLFWSNLATLVQWGSLLSVSVLLLVPMLFLGMIMPFSVKLIAQDMAHLGRDSGRVSMVSTAGSLLGTFLPALVLIPTVGSSRTFILMGLLLVFLALVGLRRYWALGLVCLGGILMLWAPPVFAMPGLIYDDESAYGHVFVQEKQGGVRNLFIDTTFGIQSVYQPNLELGNHYYSYFGLVPSMLPPGAHKVLILGHGGGIFTRVYNALYPDLEITGVELDPAVTEAGREVLNLNDLDVNIVHSDARAFLNASKESYDLILVDVYHGSSIPPHLATQEFFVLVAEHLNAGGIMAMNIASTQGPFLDGLVTTVGTEFKKLKTLAIPNSYNTMLLAGTEPFVLGEVPEILVAQKELYQADAMTPQFLTGEVFTDDKSSRVEVLGQTMLLKLFARF